MLAESYVRLNAALKDALQVEEKFEAAKLARGSRMNQLVRDGEITGKNELERTAYAEIMLMVETQDLQNATRNLNAAMLERDQARLQWEFADRLLRLIEIK